MLGLLTRGAAVVSGLLFVAFIIGIASVWARGISIDCGCFGGGGYDPDAMSKYPWEIARDAALLADVRVSSSGSVAPGGRSTTCSSRPRSDEDPSLDPDPQHTGA